MALVMKNRGISRIVVFAVLIAILMAMIPFSVMGNSIENDVKNKSKFVSLTNVTMSIGNIQYEFANGQFIGDSPEGVKVGETVKFNINWEVLEKNIKNIKNKDFFVVKLPQTHYDFKEKGNISVMATNPDTDESIAIGILSLVKNGDTAYLKVVFNSNVESVPYLKNGYLFAEGSAKEVQTSTPNSTIAGIQIPGLALVPKDDTDGEDNYWGTPPSIEEFKKTGWVDNDLAKATWYIYINYEGYNEKFSGTSSGDPEFKNVIITDELPYGVTCSGNISLKIPYFFPNMDSATNDNKTMSGKTFYTSDNYITESFTEITTDDPNVSKEDFYKMIDEAGPFHYGIWQDQKIFINVGDILGSLKLDLTWGELKAKVNDAKLGYLEYQPVIKDGEVQRDQNGKIIEELVFVDKNDAETKEATLKSYARIYELEFDSINNTTNDDKVANAVGFYISFPTTISGNDRPITNEAVLWHSISSMSSISNVIEYQNLAGGVETGIAKDVRIIKYDGSNNDWLEGVKFKLQREVSTGIYEDIPAGENGSGVQTTSSKGACMFKGLAYGNYRVVETELLEGYQEGILFKDGDGTFTIDKTTDTEILIEAFNYPENVKIPDKVLGETAPPKDSGNVLGEEATTSDLSNITPLLIGMLFMMILLLIISIQNMRRTN